MGGNEPQAPPKLDGCVSLAELTPTNVDWLWPGRIPFGKVSIIEGRPDAGKSTLTLEVAARVTSGRTLPNGLALEPMNVLLIGIEDGAEDTVLPRFIAAEGERNRAFLPPNDTMLSFPTDISRLKAYIESHDARLVVIDPVSAFLDDGINTHSDHQVRRALAPLAQMAEATGAAVVIVRHLNKGKAVDGLSAGGGSIAFTGLARTQLLLDFDPHDRSKQRRILAVSKCNLATKARALALTIDGVPGDSSRVRWIGESDLSADDLIAAQQTAEERAEGSEVDGWLSEALADGPRERSELVSLARAMGIPERTLDRAKRRLGLRCETKGFGSNKRSLWRLPAEAPSNAAISAKGDTVANPVVGSVSEDLGANGDNGGIEIPQSLRPTLAWTERLFVAALPPLYRRPQELFGWA